MAPFPLINFRKISSSPCILLKRKFAAGLLRTHMAPFADSCRNLAVSPICRDLLLESAGVGRLSWTHLSLIRISALRQWETEGHVPKNRVVLLTGTLSMLVMDPLPHPILNALWPQCPLRYLL